jgi:hypothetical protein
MNTEHGENFRSSQKKEVDASDDQIHAVWFDLPGRTFVRAG